ncbi:MAG: hypothetical protein H0V51_10800 [Chloroflexi bacterium]|nr:hypothetical protein [Chloroflexota bacterium]
MDARPYHAPLRARYAIQTATIDDCNTSEDASPDSEVVVSGAGVTLTVDEEGWRWDTSDGTTHCGTFDTIQYLQSKSDQRVGFTDKVNVRQGVSGGCGAPVSGVSLQGQVACKPNQDTGTGQSTLTVGNKRYIIQSREVSNCDAF